LINTNLAANVAAGAILAIAGALLGACANGVDASANRSPQAAPSVRIETSGGVGSGVYIGNDVIITAAHVVQPQTKTVKIKSDAGDVQNGDVLWSNAEYDVAVIRPHNSKRFRSANLQCRDVVVGEAITASGNPIGFDFITMHGFVSGGERRLEKWKSAFVTDMTTIQGMSGGPVYDEAGDVIGITAGAMVFGGGEGGMGFAVPSSVICQLLGRAQ